MEQQWRHSKGVVHKDTCEYLTEFLKKSTEDGTAVFGDEQCPNSWIVQQHPIIEKVLEEMTPKMEELTNKKLFPTYAYARLYQKGEKLACHIDRDSCEYSATINLGYSGKNWPISIAECGTELDTGVQGSDGSTFRVKNIEKLTLEVGDALIYKGRENPHWREEFEGDYQAQIFLHYVDQNGPYSSHRFDKRECLSNHNAEQKEETCLYWYMENAIADVSCDQMVKNFENLKKQKAAVGGGEGIIDEKVRDVSKVELSSSKGIGATLTGIGFNANSSSWKFDINCSRQTEYLCYDKEGHYLSHIDTFMDVNDEGVRKLTILAFLNDEFEGGRLYLQVGAERIYPPQKKGTVLVFPSFVLHGVEPVTEGFRRSVVTWLLGPWFK